MQSSIRSVQHKQSQQNQLSLLYVKRPATLGCSFRCLNVNQQMTGSFEVKSFDCHSSNLKEMIWHLFSCNKGARDARSKLTNASAFWTPWGLICTDTSPIKSQHKTAARRYPSAFYTRSYPVVSLHWSQAKKTSKDIAVNIPEETCRMDKTGSCRRNTGVSSS